MNRLKPYGFIKERNEFIARELAEEVIRIEGFKINKISKFKAFLCRMIIDVAVWLDRKNMPF